jgi:hypothetical protein
MPAINVNNSSVGGGICVTYVQQQNVYNNSEGPPPPNHLDNAGMIEAVGKQVMSWLAVDAAEAAALLRDELRQRIDKWEGDIKLRRDNLDNDSLRQISSEFEAWLNRNDRQLSREDRARGWAQLARLEFFLEDGAGKDVGE